MEGRPSSAVAAAAALKRNDWGSFILSFPSSLDARSTILHPSFLPSFLPSFSRAVLLSFVPAAHSLPWAWGWGARSGKFFGQDVQQSHRYNHHHHHHHQTVDLELRTG